MLELRFGGEDVILRLDDFLQPVLVHLRVLVQRAVVILGDLRENLFVVLHLADVLLQEVGDVLQHRLRALLKQNVVELVHLLQAVDDLGQRVFVVGEVLLKLP